MSENEDPTSLGRRSFLAASALLSLSGLGGCAGVAMSTDTPTWPLDTDEAARIDEARDDFAIVTRGSSDAGVLRRRARELPEGVFASAALHAIAARMETTMHRADGVGIAAPQVGLGLRLVCLLLDYRTDAPHLSFAANPQILERADAVREGYEGCLSVPGVGGRVLRNEWVRVRYRDLDGGEHETLAEGANAVLWQHELDHLEGVLYVDRLQGELMPTEEMRERREELERRE